MGAINCFPKDESEDKMSGDASTQEDKLAAANAKKEAAVEAGEQGEPGINYPTLTKLSKERVLAVWKEKRGEKPGPSDEDVQKAIKEKDFATKQGFQSWDQSGILEKNECQRLCESFMLRAQKACDGRPQFASWEACFNFLDNNNTGSLEKEEIKYHMQAMWLMTKDQVDIKTLDQGYTATN